MLPDAPYVGLPDDVGAALVPGGDPESVLDDATLHAALRAAAERCVVGGICNGAVLLARAGLLAGRRCTHTAHPTYAARPAFDALLDLAADVFAGATYVDEDVVVDGRVVTAKPWAAIRFGATVATVAGALDPDRAASAARYAAGWRDGPGEDPYPVMAIEPVSAAGAAPKER